MRSRFRSILHGSSTARAGVENVLFVRQLRCPADHWGPASVICRTSQFSQRKYVPDSPLPRRQAHRRRQRPEPSPTTSTQDTAAPRHATGSRPPDGGRDPVMLDSLAVGGAQAASGSGERLT